MPTVKCVVCTLCDSRCSFGYDNLSLEHVEKFKPDSCIKFTQDIFDKLLRNRQIGRYIRFELY
jgi:hypothetical protein